MSRKLINNLTAAFCTVALLFAVTVGVEAQSDDPIFEDDIICSIQIGSDWHVAPAAKQNALENHHGQTATVESMAALLLRLPQAGTFNTVRFEGGYPGGSVGTGLDNLGYTLEVPVTPLLNGVNTAVLRTA